MFMKTTNQLGRERRKIIMAANEAGEKTVDCYPGTSRTRPKELEVDGFGDYCCIPCCKSTTLDRYKNKSGIGMFSFPVSDKETFKKWLSIVSTFRRKGGADHFEVKKNTKICEFHFDISCIRSGHGTGRKNLVPGRYRTYNIYF